MRVIHEIADMRGTTDDEARRFCLEVQGFFKGPVPPCTEIKRVLERNPRLGAKEIALLINPFLQYRTPVVEQPRSESSTAHKARQAPAPKSGVFAGSPRGKRRRPSERRKPRPEPVLKPELVAGVADLIPDEDRGNLAAARQFLRDLYYIHAWTSRASPKQILTAVRKASRKGTLEMDRVVEELRKSMFGSTDHTSVISTPMGGKRGR